MQKSIEPAQKNKPATMVNAFYKITGTSGYSYDHWTSDQFQALGKEGFYPPNIKKNRMFAHYAKFFDFVEINNTFYGNPSEKTIDSWYETSPSNFRFLVKANKYITHTKKLLDFETTFCRAFDLYLHLKEKCLGILLQLPPLFECNQRNIDRIRSAGKYTQEISNPYNYQIFIEFRHPSWFQSNIYDLLREVKWSLTVVNLNNTSQAFGKMNSGFYPTLEEITNGNAITINNTIMFRCHGTFESRAYMGGYSDEDLILMSSLVSSMHRGLIVFDNTDSYEFQLDTGWMRTKRGYALVFDPILTILNPEKILPHAVSDALKVKELIT